MCPERTINAGARIAVIGTGIMGGHMARRLAEAGFDVAALDNDPARLDALKVHGIEVTETPAAALPGAGVALVMLPTGDVVDEVLFKGPEPGITSLDPGATLLVMSSIPVEQCRGQGARAIEHGLVFVEAPVSGGEDGARDGTLTILAGGDAQAIAALAPVFAPLGTPHHMGGIGMGQTAKLTNQILVGANLLGVAEAFRFAANAGVDLSALHRALGGGFGASRVLDLHGARMIAKDYEPGSPSMYQLKDLKTARGFADTLEMDANFLNTLISWFTAMSEQGYGAKDVAAIFEVESTDSPIDTGSAQ